MKHSFRGRVLISETQVNIVFQDDNQMYKMRLKSQNKIGTEKWSLPLVIWMSLLSLTS